MSDSKTAAPDEDLLEFLGGIDEVNDQDDGFADFLAVSEIDSAAAEKPKTPPKDPKTDE